MSDTLQTTGTIIMIGETQELGDNGFTKREFVVEIPDGKDGKYNQQVPFEVVKDNCQSLDAYSEGDEVTVSFNLRGREYNGRYYVNLSAWRLARVGTAVNAAPSDDARQLAKDEDPEEEIPF